MSPRAAWLHSSVELDLDSAAFWYDVQAGLGSEFLAEAERVLSSVTARPMMYALRWENVRMAPLSRFPYGIFYTVDAGSQVRVWAISSRQREPLHWATRMR